MCQIKHSFFNFLPSPFKIGFRKHFPKEMNFAYLCKHHIALSVWNSSFLNSKMFKWWAESPNEKSIVGPFLSIQWKFIYGCKKEINQAQWKCSSQTISVQGDSAPPTSQVGDLFYFSLPNKSSILPNCLEYSTVLLKIPNLL